MAISRKGRLNCLEKLWNLRQIYEGVTDVHAHSPGDHEGTKHIGFHSDCCRNQLRLSPLRTGNTSRHSISARSAAGRRKASGSRNEWTSGMLAESECCATEKAEFFVYIDTEARHISHLTALILVRIPSRM
jgi:hypothetical protein